MYKPSRVFKSLFILSLWLIQLPVYPVALSQTVIFRENFDDAKFSPVVLTEPLPSQEDAGIATGIRETRDGSHFMRSEGGEHVFTRVTDLSPPHSMEVRARLTELPTGSGEFISIGVVNDYGDEFYWGGIYANGRGAAGAATFDQFFFDETNERLVPNPLDWFKLRLDVDDDELSLWAWPATLDRPEQPAVTYPTDRFDKSELTSAFIDWNGPNSGTQPWLEVDYLKVTTLSGPAGDFNLDTFLDAADIDLLTEMINLPDEAALRFDVNEDQVVDIKDHRYWVSEIKSTWLGDANMDGEFNSSDFVTVFQTGKFETDEQASWTDGDWNGDQRFDTGDFVAAFQEGGYEMGMRAAVPIVPEPSGWMVPILSLIGIGFIRRRCAA